MRSNKQLRRTVGLRVTDAHQYGGYGEVHIRNWTGSVIWGRDEEGWEHVSVSPYVRRITPSWDDMCALKEMFFDDEEMVLQFHTRKSQYVNKMENCLHLWRPKNRQLLELLEGRE